MVENFRKYDLSFIVVAHAEGRMLHPCLTSVDRAVAQFEQAGHSAERILVLSDASEATKRWAGEMRQPGWRLLSSDHPDPGRARNLALRESRSDYVALLDGWDLTCGHWLVAALEADRREGPAAWHPEAAIRFGEILTCSTQFHPDAVAFGYDYAAMIDTNPYSGGVFARREIFRDIPFPEGDASRGFAFADWHWNCEVVAQGCHHRLVLRTWHYVRLHRGQASLAARERAAKSRIGPTALFSNADRSLVNAGKQ